MPRINSAALAGTEAGERAVDAAYHAYERDVLSRRYQYPADVVAGLAGRVVDHLLAYELVADARRKLTPSAAREWAWRLDPTRRIP